MKQSLLIFILNITVFNLATGQQVCDVKIKSISGNYSGACDNGVADGVGKSVGEDQYEGEFKKGYPDGKGTYTWKDGHYYIGVFKKGKKEGEGKMYFESVSGADSIIAGYWKKDKYIGKYENQFIVYAQTSKINKVQCNVVGNNDKNITIEVHQLSSSTSYNSPGVIPIVSNVLVENGSYYSKNVQVLSNRSVLHIQGVVFPFRALFTLSNGETTDILLNEDGEYSIYIDIM